VQRFAGALRGNEFIGFQPKSVSALAPPPRHFLPHLLQGQRAAARPRILGPRRQQFAPQCPPGPRWPRRFPLQLLADGVSHPGTAV
jgi:hypothetical protein